MKTALLAALLTISISGTASAYRVESGRIVDDSGARVTLRGVNWFGFETETRAPHGLWARNMDEMLDQMKALGFNAVRLPLCPGTLRAEAASSIDYGRNPSLRGLNSLQLLDTVIAGLERRGLYFVIDHHRPDCKQISELWYTQSYSEAQWIADLEFIAARYKDRGRFVGIDLKNEPHGAATWGTGNAATDWNLAAERAGRAVLAKAPKQLVFVEGIARSDTCTSTQAGTWWGGNLAPQACKPLALPADKLVLSPHVYGPDVYQQSYFHAADFPANLPAIWDAHFGALKGRGHAIAVGETGGKYGSGDQKDKVFQQALLKYLRQRGIVDLFYWSWNPNSSDTGGILGDDWASVRDDKMALLRDYWSATPPPGDPMPDPATPLVKLTKSADWGSGYCANVDVTNKGNAPLSWRIAEPVEGRITQLWNAAWSQSGATLNAQGVQWNATLAPGATAQFGFCAVR